MPIETLDPGLRVFRFQRFEASGIDVALVTTRDVRADRSRPRLPEESLLAAANVPGDRIAWATQVHGARILASTVGGPQGRADAMLTDRRGLTLAISVADCLPVFLAASGGGPIALVHAGWRGARARVASAAVRALTRLYGVSPSELWAGIGPGIGACCYQVGRDVAEAFDPRHLQADGERWRLDLASAVGEELRAAGVPGGQIDQAGLCTSCRADLFHSYRRNGTDARLFALLGRHAESTRS